MTEGISFPKKYLDFVCEPYKSSYASYLNAFQLIKIKDEKDKEVLYKDVEDHIRDSGRLSDANIFKTYLVFYENKAGKSATRELACVFCLRCSSMHFENPSKENFFSEVIPGIELVYFGVEEQYHKRHPKIIGTGVMVFDAFIVPIVQEINRLCGCKNLFLFAINNKKLIKHYMNRMDFLELPEEEEKEVHKYLKTYNNHNCKFLFQPIENM